MKHILYSPDKSKANAHDSIKKKSSYPQEKSETSTNTSNYKSLKSESHLKLNNHHMGFSHLNHLRRNNQIFDIIKPASFEIIPSKSLNSLNILSKNETNSYTSFSSSISSHSGASFSPCSNFTDTDLKHTNNQPQTSTPILLRNQVNRCQSTSPKSAWSDSNYDTIEGFTSFNAALIHQKTLLKARKQTYIKNKSPDLIDISQGFKMYDHISRSRPHQSPCPVSPILSTYSDESSTASVIINAKSGTIRGNMNHVKTSVKKVFEKGKHITYPVNAQLNDVSITSLHQSNNYNVLSDSIDLSIYDEKPPNESAYTRVMKLNEKSLNFLARNYQVEEYQKIVIYTTTLQIVRLSYDKCKKVKKILQNYCVRYEEKDLYKHKAYQKELMYRLNLEKVDVPHIFFNGRHIANCDQLELYSDQGLLHKLFKDLDKIKLKIYCSKCGGYRYMLCSLCNGSKKKFNNFMNLKCTVCTEDGLVRCDECLDQQE